jgi:hypothetical protein
VDEGEAAELYQLRASLKGTESNVLEAACDHLHQVVKQPANPLAALFGR